MLVWSWQRALSMVKYLCGASCDPDNKGVPVMLREMLRSKIHRATITEADLNYEGSLSLCPELRKAADMLVYEKIAVVNINNGNRFETYIIEGKKGQICLNGAAARLGHVGDKIIIMSYCQMDDAAARKYLPIKVLVDEKNRISSITS